MTENAKKLLGVIPARYASTRFDGKPLVLISGIPMIKRTYMQASKSRLLDKVIVATDDSSIADYCESQGMSWEMTSSECLTGTDRVAEVALRYDYDFYINIQGDEPVIDPASIDQLLGLFLEFGSQYAAYNLYKFIDNPEMIASKTIIKVITNAHDEVMYMSRLPVPHSQGAEGRRFKQQVPVYGFTQEALEVFAASTKTLNERFEDIEMLRFVDLGYKVKMQATTVSSIAVDVPEDVRTVEAFLQAQETAARASDLR